MNEQTINELIAKRDKMLQRRDGLYDIERVNAIDAKLRDVPAGQREDVDEMLGRVLPNRIIHDPESPREILARKQRADMDDETILANWPLCSAACQIRRERYQATVRWSTDEEREAARAHGEAEAARLAAEKHDDFLMHIADQHEDMLNFLRLCGDLAL